MRKEYKNELEGLGVSLSRMGGMAEDLLSRSLEALTRRNPSLAEGVVADDQEIDAMELEINDQTVRILALRQPLAVDLREVVATLKIASTLERIGDLSKNNARRAANVARIEPKLNRSIVSVVRLGKLVREQFASVLDALITRDTAAALRIWKRDAEVDELYNSLARDIVGEMQKSPEDVELGMHLLFIAKNLERIGDHATFVAEMIAFIVSGSPMPLDRPKGEPDGAAIFAG